MKKIDANNEKTSAKAKKSFPIIRITLGIVLLLLLVYFGFTCEVREGSSAVILRFGAPRSEITEAGLYFKLPWPFETVVNYDSRLQYLESNYLETTTKDNRNIILQSYALWNVSNPLVFHNSVGSLEKVDSYIKDQIFSATNSVLGTYELSKLVSLDKESIKTEEIQNKIYSMVKLNCENNYGVTISDVSILRISLPDTNLESVFEQMKAERQKDIDTIIANAQRDADKIMSDAETDYAEIVANGEIEAADIKAKTEAEVAKIYSDAQAANLELYQFLKELDTLIASVEYDAVLVVTADNYPFNILLNYSDSLTEDDEESVITDLNYILTQLNEKDRNALIDAIYALIREAGGK